MRSKSLLPAPSRASSVWQARSALLLAGVAAGAASGALGGLAHAQQPAAAAPITAPAAMPLPASVSPAAAATVDVRSFKIEGNTLFDSARLAAVLDAWRGQRTFAELRLAAQAVQGIYSAAGYGAVVAYLPPQAVSDGVVNITVVEGKVAKVTVRGNKRQSADRLRAALPSLVEGATPRVRRVDSELQIANENPARQVGVLLGPGAQAGEVEATVQVEEQPVQRWTLALDNSGNDRTGQWRISAGWQHADITGRDDVLNLQLQTSPTETSKVRVASLGYRLPLVPWLSALDVFAAYSNVDGGTQATAAGDLRFSGRGHIAGARSIWYLPRAGEYDQRLTVGLEYRAYLNSCQVGGLGAGACGPAGESVSVTPLTLEYAAQTGGPVAAGITVALAHNLSLGGGNNSAASFAAVRAGARPGYTVLRAGGNLSLPVGLPSTWPFKADEDWTVAARTAVQYSGDNLVPGEQFGLGGAASVRGYQERELAGDTGVQLALELVSPRIDAGEQGARTDLRLLAFVDTGQVSNQGSTACLGTQTHCTLTSWGLGARLGWGAVQMRLFAAQALDDAATTRRKSWRSHVALSATF